MLLLVGIVSTGCDLLGVGASSEHALQLRLEAPEEVAQNDSITVQYQVINRRNTELTVEGVPCVALVQVFKDDEQIPMEGTADGCILPLWRHTFAPQDTLTHESTLQIRLRDSEDPVVPGEYRIRAVPGISTGDGENVDLPTINRPLTVLAEES